MNGDPVRVGVVGCGNISGIYLENLTERFAETVQVVACADLDEGRAKERAAEFGVPKAGGVAELLADGEVEVVLNLTTPPAHATVALAALREGKHVYGEKPLAVDLRDARKVLEEAEARGLLVGCAPDTFMGAGLQTCLDVIEEGRIGEPVAATAFMTNHGHESWHPDPGFYYKAGGGPMFDMGPYYLTALVALIGPVRRVSGSARASFGEREISSEPKRGERIEVEVPTHVAGTLDFENGAIGTIVTSFDVWAANLPRIEIYGSEGSLSVPDPNNFGGPVRLLRAGAAWEEVPVRRDFAENSRGLGVADMARAVRDGGHHRATGALAYHVLEVMHALHDSSGSGRHVGISSTFDRPAPMPKGAGERVA